MMGQDRPRYDLLTFLKIILKSKFYFSNLKIPLSDDIFSCDFLSSVFSMNIPKSQNNFLQHLGYLITEVCRPKAEPTPFLRLCNFLVFENKNFFSSKNKCLNCNSPKMFAAAQINFFLF